LLDLLDQTPVSEETRDRIRVYVAGDFGAQKALDEVGTRSQAELEPIPTRGLLSLEEIRALARKDWLKLREQQRGESLSGERDRKSQGQEGDNPPIDSGIGLDDDTTE
jgi:hypothetical protein